MGHTPLTLCIQVAVSSLQQASLLGAFEDPMHLSCFCVQSVHIRGGPNPDLLADRLHDREALAPRQPADRGHVVGRPGHRRVPEELAVLQSVSADVAGGVPPGRIQVARVDRVHDAVGAQKGGAVGPSVDQASVLPEQNPIAGSQAIGPAFVVLEHQRAVAGKGSHEVPDGGLGRERPHHRAVRRVQSGDELVRRFPFQFLAPPPLPGVRARDDDAVVDRNPAVVPISGGELRGPELLASLHAQGKDASVSGTAEDRSIVEGGRVRELLALRPLRRVGPQQLALRRELPDAVQGS
mmetsp:Transcript_80024/g.193998  ORF Transcript_80024/g.193998 Transcript_80024/m.193998 type:complete len:295 (+) Transcript_80024:293-1177(+)